MTHYLLTGASGLLGSYLLRDCLLAGYPMAVLVRPTRTQSAQERVDARLAYWQEQTGRTLPRPTVLEGDLCYANLNLTASDLRWVANRCRAVIHSAASLTFFGSDRRREPWLTNVEGTRRLLDLCRECGIPEFHYVSTAYVCGLREGPILETQLDLGQPMGNDYERSKLEAEKLVRSAVLARPPTIYRPSIIVGDSQTGYTCTFHGFYAMVKLAHTLASQIAPYSSTAGIALQTFNLRGQERKDFVPVDWVSAMIVRLLGHPEHHGRTYHLTAAQPTPAALWTQAIQEAVYRYSSWADPSDSTGRDVSWANETCRAQAEIYRAYWRDDPRFDCTHTVAAAPQLPCPVVDHDMLLRMATFAIQTNFRKRLPASRSGVTPAGV